MAQYTDMKYSNLSNNANMNWNKKLCFEARDTLFDCVDAQPNGNKMRCPDELYAYEMWCPNEFRLLTSANRRQQKIDDIAYDKNVIDQLNR